MFFVDLDCFLSKLNCEKNYNSDIIKTRGSGHISLVKYSGFIMKKHIISDFIEVVLLFGADHKRRFNRQGVAKVFTVMALIGLTAVFAAMATHFGVFKIGADEAIDWSTALAILGSVAIPLIIGLLVATLATGGMILIPIAEMWNYISEKYGNKQHIINVFLFALCVVFFLYTMNLVNILEYLSGESYHGAINADGTMHYGRFLTFVFTMITIFTTSGIFCWLSGISKAWTSAVKAIIAIEKARMQRLRQENPKEYYCIRRNQAKEKPLDESEQLEMFDMFGNKQNLIEEFIVCSDQVLCDKVIMRLFILPKAVEVICLYVHRHPLPPAAQMRAFELPENEAKEIIFYHQRLHGLCDEAAQKLKELGWKKN